MCGVRMCTLQQATELSGMAAGLSYRVDWVLANLICGLCATVSRARGPRVRHDW
eukprot:COSAG06_NODE_1994_length_7889_cov_8.566752_12_plen_54_part_00